MTVKRMTEAEWNATGEALFGTDRMTWRFVCPSCLHVASVRDWFDANAPEGGVAFSCVGRYLGADGSKTFRLKGGPCNYTTGGLFNLSRIIVVREDGSENGMFEFEGMK